MVSLGKSTVEFISKGLIPLGDGYSATTVLTELREILETLAIRLRKTMDT
jgi:hypothetical protein